MSPILDTALTAFVIILCIGALGIVGMIWAAFRRFMEALSSAGQRRDWRAKP